MRMYRVIFENKSMLYKVKNRFPCVYKFQKVKSLKTFNTLVQF
jgi:hypothetical protein